MKSKDNEKVIPIDTPLPGYAEKYLIYQKSIRGKSENTIREYRYDLLMFYGYFAEKRHVEELSDMGLDFVRSITLDDLYIYVSYLDDVRHQKANTRARKVSSLRSFFKYLHAREKLIEANPAQELELPKLPKRNPVYLELDESISLLESIDGENEERDYLMITLFLNCGMRLSELCGINISGIREDKLTIIGKGNKERTVYLNNACINALNGYLAVRPKLEDNDPSADALFLSERKQRISGKTVQYAVKKYLMKCGIDTTKYSTHKLRHTCATLLYKYGEVDIRSLQELLGHTSISTTEIYTHVDNGMLAEAVKKNPLSDLTGEEKNN